MACALYASSAAMLGLRPEAEAACDWLERDAVKPDGRVGWGLPFAWDAFGDGSVNSADTVYGITTALAVRALADSGRGEGIAADALRYYLACRTETPEGTHFWYSDQLVDTASVFNVTAMLAGQYARLGRIMGERVFLAAAEGAFAYLDAHRRVSTDGDYWNYGPGIARPNDSVHAAYMLIGMTDAAKYLAIDWDADAARRYIRRFFRDDRCHEFVAHESMSAARLRKPARPWGLGALLYAACESADPDLCEVVEKHIAESTAPEAAQPVHVRDIAHIAWGLSRATLL